MKLWNKAWDVVTLERVSATAFSSMYNPRRSHIKTVRIFKYHRVQGMNIMHITLETCMFFLQAGYGLYLLRCKK
jgi:hypothetical protein